MEKGEEHEYCQGKVRHVTTTQRPLQLDVRDEEHSRECRLVEGEEAVGPRDQEKYCRHRGEQCGNGQRHRPFPPTFLQVRARELNPERDHEREEPAFVLAIDAERPLLWQHSQEDLEENPEDHCPDPHVERDRYESSTPSHRHIFVNTPALLMHRRSAQPTNSS